jgi:MFS family permease
LYSVGAILFSAAFFLAGNGLISTLTPLRADLEGFSALALGALGAFYYAGFAAGCFAGPHLFVRTGHVRAFSIAAAFSAASILLQPISSAQIVWFSLRAATGLCVAVLYMTLESWLNERATNETRGRVLSTYIVVNFGAIILGQWLLLLGSPTSFELFTIAVICFCFCLVPVGLTRLPQPNPHLMPRLDVKKLFSIAPVGAAACITVGLANSAFWALAPPYTLSLGFDARQLALFMSVFVAGGALLQWPLGRISDKVDRRGIIALICTVGAILGLLLGLFGRLLLGVPEIFYTLIFLLGGSVLPLFAIGVAHAHDRLPSADFLQTSASLLMIFAAASVVGPVLASVFTVITNGYAGALFIFIALANALMAFFAFTRERLNEALSEDKSEAFSSLPQGSVAAFAMDPRKSKDDT